jgi:hypothetical protein
MGMNQFCHSCSAPLNAPGFKGPSDTFCRNCTDEQGILKSKEEIHKGMAGWLKSWQPGIDDKTAAERATHFMKAMPAWAEE